MHEPLVYSGVYQLIIAVDWVQILFAPFLSELPFCSHLCPSSNAGGWSWSSPQLPAPRSEHHHHQVFGSLSFLHHCLCLAMSNEHFGVRLFVSTLVMCNLATHDRILHSCGFLLFFFFLQVLNIFLFGSSGDRYVTVGLTSNQVNSSSAHVQPASPPLSWDPTLTPNLTMLQKFL